MKKTNGKFRSNNNNNSSIYSLNYKFDSVSSAGKFNGTALDLIKRYNELAKEAQSRGDYVDMEVYRQYAEHYRKIVTEINVRKNQNREGLQTAESETIEQTQNTETESQQEQFDNGLVETQAAPREDVIQNENAEKPTKKRAAKRAFTIVEVKDEGDKPEESANENIKAKNVEETPVEQEKPKRHYTSRRKVLKTDAQ